MSKTSLVLIIIYASLAVALVILFNFIIPIGFFTQLLIQAGLILLLLIAWFTIFMVSEKSKDVKTAQAQNRSGIEDMKEAMQKVQNTAYISQKIPTEICQRITRLEESLRYLSPSDNPESAEPEREFIVNATILSTALAEDNPDPEKITEIIARCERIYQQRKQPQTPKGA